MTKIVASEDTEALVRDTEIAIQLGRELMDWWADHATSVQEFEIPIRDQDLVQVSAFYETMDSDTMEGGSETSVMACLQTARFHAQRNSAADGVPLSAFLKSQYPSNAGWEHSDGSPAGFGYEALIYKPTETAAIGRFENGTHADALDFSAVGTKYDWMTLRVDIHDFLRASPIRLLAKPLSRFIKEAAYVAIHPAFALPVGDPPSGTLAECLFGYSFLPCACEASFFGFGPGHFTSAIKQFRFSLLQTGELQVKLAFIVAPRSQKVLDLWGFDPVYRLFHGLNALTLGKMRIKEVAHNRLDKSMLAVHARVHHNLLKGMKPFWVETNWVAD